MVRLTGKPEFPALTGLRFVAATLIFWFHANPDLKNTPVWLNTLLNEGYIGVNLFFVLSGFLIAHSLKGRDKDFSLSDYLLRRFARVYPLFAFFTLLVFAVGWIRYPGNAWYSTWSLVLNLSLLKSFSAHHFLSGVPQSWSLGAELVFYLLAPWLVLAAVKRPWAFLAFPIIFYAIGFGLTFLNQSYFHSSFFRDLDFTFNYTFFGRSAEFLAGVFFATFRSSTNESESIPWRTFTGIIFTLALWGILGQVKGTFEFGMQSPAGRWLHHLGLPFLGFGPLIWGLSIERTWLSGILANPVFKILGFASYALYLLHLGPFANVLKWLELPSWVNFLMSIAASVLVWRFLEEPMRKFLVQNLSSAKSRKG